MSPTEKGYATMAEASEAQERSAPDRYAEAVKELEGILDNLDNSEVDVDLLAVKVGRAAELLKFCRKRLEDTEMQVNQIVADLESESRQADGVPEGRQSAPASAGEADQPI